MKNIIYFFIFCMILFSGYKLPEETPLSILLAVEKNYNSHQSMEYKISYRRKTFSRNDTITVNGYCKLEKEETDTIYGGKLWFLARDSFEWYYNLENIYLVNHSKKNITEYEAHKGQTSAIDGNIAGEIINVRFLDLNKLILLVKDTSNYIELSKEDSNNKITINLPDHGKSKERKYTLWVSQGQNRIDKLCYTLNRDGSLYYSSWTLSDVKFDKVSFEEIADSLLSLSRTYKTEQYNPLTPADYKPIDNGELSPAIQGINFQTGELITAAMLENKITILDFSYMACFPCIKAIPHLVEIQKEYKDVLILLLNSSDNSEKGRKRLPSFIEKNQINYPVVLTNRYIDQAFNVKIYPTIYVLGKDGKIVYSHLGFSETLKDSLIQVIKKLK